MSILYGNAPVARVIEPRGLSQDEVDALADRMAVVALVSLIEGASPWQMRHWMRTALYGHLNQAHPLGEPGEEKEVRW